MVTFIGEGHFRLAVRIQPNFCHVQDKARVNFKLDLNSVISIYIFCSTETKKLIIIITSCKFSAPVLADDLSLECELQQAFQGLQNSSQYSGQSKQCCYLDGLHSSSYSNSSSLLFKGHQIQFVSPSTVDK